MVPFNPEEVLERFTVQLKTPTPPGSQSTNSAPTTPYNLRQLEKQASTVKTLLKRHTGSPISLLDKMITGHEMALGILARQEIRNCELHMKNFKSVRDLGGRSLLKKAFLFRRARLSYREGARRKKSCLLHLRNQCPMAEYRSGRAPP